MNHLIRKNKTWIVFSAIFFIIHTFVFASEAKKILTFDSLYSYERAVSVAISPGGSQLLITSQRSIIEENHSQTIFRLTDLQGKNERILNFGQMKAWNLKFIGDGQRIAFIAIAGKEAPQVFTIRLNTGEITQITHHSPGIRDFQWSPVDDGLVFVSPIYPENNTIEHYHAEKKRRSEQKHGGLLYNHLLFRPYNYWDNGEITHIYHQRFSDNKTTDVTPGPYFAPSSHLGGARDLELSPDGRVLAFTMNTDPVKAISTNNDVFTVSVDGTGLAKRSESPGNDNDPRFSPDGKYLLYLQMARAQYEADKKDIILLDLKTGVRQNLTASLDRSADWFMWSRNARLIWFTCMDQGLSALYQIEIKSGKLTKMLDNRYFSSVTADAEGKNFYLLTGDCDTPDEVYCWNAKTLALTPLTHFSQEFLAGFQTGRTETFWYNGERNDRVMGYITFPPNMETGRKYPMVMLFHGGPEGAWSGNFSNYGWNSHLMAANGYITVKINPHGSSSYGMAFQEALLGDWGGVDVEDVLTCLDYLKTVQPAIDMERVGALGRSYGGYLVNMLNGKTNRFKCFVSVDGILDQFVNYYATDELWFVESEFKGTPLTSPEIYKKSSPMTFAANFKTPALIIHGGRDFRVDLSQGVGMFTLLQRQGIPSQLLVFPDESHYFTRIQTWKYAYEVQFNWLARWLKEEGADAVK